MQELSLRDATKALVSIIRHNDKMAKFKMGPHTYIVPYFQGSPGIGKTALVNDAAEQTGRKARTLILAQYDPADIGGFVYRDGDRMHKARPAFLPEAGCNDVLFLDEFSQSGQAVQNVAAQLVYDRRVGVHEISPLSTIVCAGNRQSDRAGTAPLVRHFLNRVTSTGIVIPVEHWIEWAAGAGVHPSVVGYIAWRKTESLNKFDAKLEQSPTPRAWENVSKVMNLGFDTTVVADRTIIRALTAGYVGDAEAGTFMGFLKVMDELPNPKDIIARPSTAPVPQDQQIIYATVIALCGHAEDNTVAPIITYLDRLERKEFTVFAIRYMNNKNKALINNKAITGWMARNAKLFV